MGGWAKDMSPRAQPEWRERTRRLLSGMQRQAEHKGKHQQGDETQVKHRLEHSGIQHLDLNVSVRMRDLLCGPGVSMLRIIRMDAGIFEVDLGSVALSNASGFYMTMLVQPTHLHEQ